MSASHGLGQRPLASYAHDTYSQCGEDGILAEILNRLAQRHALNHWCVEFGAWDGVFLSNTARLIRDENFRAVLIEGDRTRASQLPSAHPDREVIALNTMVGSQGEQRLDALLTGTPVPIDCDVLSIDIDGCDYHVWAAVERYRPKIVVIEFNPSIPNEVEWIQTDNQAVHHGSSAAALYRLAIQKGYVPVAFTQVNMIAVSSEYAEAVIGPEQPTLAELRDDTDALVFVFVGYDGSLHTNRPVVMQWHLHTVVPERRLQVLPRALRRFRGGTSATHATWRHAMAAWINPGQEISRLRDRFRR